MTNTINRARRHRKVLGLAVGAVAATTLVLTATPASAAGAPAAQQPHYSSYVDSYNSSGVNLRSCGSTTCGSYAYMPNDTGVTMQCWEDTQSVSPPNSNYTSSRWFRVSSPYGTGYVHSSLVFNQTGVGPC
jgi:hypothetical protein